MLVLGGDVSSMSRIQTYLKQNPPMPVIIFEGTGGTADVMAYALRYCVFKIRMK